YLYVMSNHTHNHDHSHHHSPVSGENKRNVLLAFVLTFSFMLIELLGGLWSGSLALIADAGHMLTDASALALAWLAFVAGSRQAGHRRTFGYLRFEVLASLVNGLALFAIAIWISVEAWQRIQQ